MQKFRRSRTIFGGCIMENEMHVRFLSKLENVQLARTLAVGFLVDLDLNLNTVNEIKTIISEAVTNSIIHGYEEKDGIVKIECRLFANSIEIEISDNGKGIFLIVLAN